MKYILTTLTLLFFTFHSFALEKEFHHISELSGLTNKVVKNIYRDKKGFLWLGTQNGLHRYDGYQMKVYRSKSDHNNTLSSNDINVIFEDDQEHLWVGTTTNLHRLNDDGESFTRVFSKSPLNNSNFSFEITSILQTKEGQIWVGTKRAGLFELDRNGNIIQNILGSEENPYLGTITALVKDHDGNLWIGHDDLQLTVYNKKANTFSNVYLDKEASFYAGNKASNITTLALTENKKILAGTLHNGLFLIDPNNKKVNYLLQTNKALKHPSVKDIVIDHFQNIWVATSDGLHLLSSFNYQVISVFRNSDLKETSIASNGLLSLHYDQQNILWCGFYGEGVDYLEPNYKKFRTFRREVMNYNSLNHETVQSILEDSKGNIWFGTREGSISKLNQKTNRYEHFKPEDGNPHKLQKRSVLAISEDHKGTIWIGSYLGGLSKLNPKTKTVKTYKNNPLDSESLPHDDVRFIFEDSKKQLWVATNGGGLALFDRENETFRTFTRENTKGNNPLASNWVLNVFEDSRGWLWVGTYGGLSIYYPEQNSWVSFVNRKKDKNSLAHNWIYSITESRDGSMWIGSAGGLNKIAKDKLKHPITNYYDGLMKRYSEKEGLVSNAVHGLLEDESNNLWISSNTGISKFNIQEETFKHFTKEDGLQGNQFNPMAYCKTRAGELIFGGTNGANAFFPKEIRTNLYKPNVILTNFSIFNREVLPDSSGTILKKSITNTSEILLDYFQNVITFSFVSLNMINPEKNEYAYIMEGFDKDWNYVGKKREAIYTNLDPGQYIFRVKGTNNDGLWNEKGQEVLLIIQPPFWQTWWFRFLVLVILLMTIVVGYRWKVRSYKREQQALEKIVQDRTHELAEKNNDLIEINNEVHQQAEKLEKQRDDLTMTNKDLKDKNDKISNLVDQLQKANGEIVSKNRHITDSIRYAQTMQEAILPIKESYDFFFQNHFIIFKPKDIVSGDFYWVSTKDDQNRLFVAVVDCTGHGVPGAFMSMIGVSLLNKIVNEYNIETPSEILQYLDEGIRKALKQEQSKNTDGMDLSIVRIDKNEKNELCFASAKGSMFLYNTSDQNLKRVIGDKKSIGGKQRKQKKEFTDQYFQLQKGDRFYMLTDGYIDQCDIDRKKFGTVKFEKILSQTSMMSFDKQYKLLLDVLRIHQGKEEQRDDITILGFEL
ncbi:two-component regulator propeller domain-containing protein [Flammeovirga sp. EKP202]|uniref:two-component regulator propeller domain-containing protein n=1 Tax=Flammeovirga sp. EKP202 TaxID=2770592 RepID=UPI00165F9380|nr:two-component regulator propeller domain-containing protein [Flammeovirga sp. EKP202]MBD0404237.1 SpoIIE family protein phosphatase [Flammeovirga sp. EKP202]